MEALVGYATDRMNSFDLLSLIREHTLMEPDNEFRTAFSSDRITPMPESDLIENIITSKFIGVVHSKARNCRVELITMIPSCEDDYTVFVFVSLCSLILHCPD